jgi:hypothetical protein
MPHYKVVTTKETHLDIPVSSIDENDPHVVTLNRIDDTPVKFSRYQLVSYEEITPKPAVPGSRVLSVSMPPA